MEARLVLTTAPDVETARGLAHGLVERRFAACVNVLPGATSVYRWEGAVQEEAEVLLVIKTRAARLAEVEELLAEHHPYDVPELVALEPAHVERAYLDWLLQETAEA
jgi:periplasmic divalent cation tolerance protein